MLKLSAAEFVRFLSCTYKLRQDGSLMMHAVYRVRDSLQMPVASIAHRLRAVHSALAFGQTVTQPSAGSMWHGHTNMQVICCSNEHVCPAGHTVQTSTKSLRESCNAEMHSCKQAARHTWSTVACTFLVSVVVMVCRAMGC